MRSQSSCPVAIKLMYMILLDFAKAFDNVTHGRLLYKLAHYDVRGTLKKWITSLLGDRKQRVFLGSCKSAQVDVLSEIPQGMTLGPLLFLAFINDLPACAKHSDTRLFADEPPIPLDKRPVWCSIAAAGLESPRRVRKDLADEFSPVKVYSARISP